MPYRKISIALYVSIALVIITTLLLGILGGLEYKWNRDERWAGFRKDLAWLSEEASASLVVPAWDFNRDQIDNILESIMKNPEVYGILVRLADVKSTLAGRVRDDQWSSKKVDRDFSTSGFLVEERNITFSGRTIGAVKVAATTKYMEGQLKTNLIHLVFVILLVDLILILSLYLLFWHIVLNPLRNVEHYASEVSLGKSVELKVRGSRTFGELSSLKNSIEEMVNLLRHRYQDLQEQANQLEESEKRFRTIFNSVNDAIFIHDKNTGAILDVNQKMREMYGYSQVEALVLDISSLSAEDARFNQEAAFCLIQKAARGEPQMFEWQAKHKDGRLFWVEVNMKLARIGEIDRVLVVARDSTERRRTEQELKQSQSNLTALIESTNDLIWSVDTNYGLLTYNSSFEAHFKKNYGTQAYVGATLKDFLPLERAVVWPLYYKRALTEGQCRLEYSLSDGRILELAFNPMLRDGTPIGISVFGKDVTERKKVEEALKHSQQLLVKTFSSLHEAIFIVDPKMSQIVDCNPGALEVFGYSREHMLGRTTEFLHVDEAALEEFRRHLYHSVKERGSLHSFEFRMKRKDGSVFPTEHSVMPLEGEQGESLGWVSVVRDITERKRAEEALRHSEVRYRGLFESARDAIFMMKEDRFIDCNPATLTMFGCRKEEIWGKHQ